MSPDLIVDLALLIVVLLSLVAGWRQGAFSAVFSAVGVVAGLVLGLTIAPLLLKLSESQVVRVLLLVAVVVLFVGVGNLVGATVGTHLRNSVRHRATQRLDSLLGAFFQALVTLIVVWCLAVPLAAAVPGKLGAGLRESRGLSALDAAMPPAMQQLPSKLAALIDESGLPPLVSPFARSNRQVEAPNSAVLNSELVRALRPSIIHVMGDAETCSRRLMGSGFVIADDYVLTNAHVVAGTEEVALDTVVGVKQATVVLYDPDADIAVLHSPDLGIPALQWTDGTLPTSADAIVMGFPLSGPFEAIPVRIRARITIAGPDIYATGRVEREAYTIRGDIKQGNSGGPLLTPQGQVAGMIFGASVDATQTGYALTARQVLERIGDVQRLREPVGTGECVAG